MRLPELPIAKRSPKLQGAWKQTILASFASNGENGNPNFGNPN
jgi:hypothetical protein